MFTDQLTHFIDSWLIGTFFLMLILVFLFMGLKGKKLELGSFLAVAFILFLIVWYGGRVIGLISVDVPFQLF